MPKVRDDCFAAGSDLMPLAEALALLAGRIRVAVGIETVPLASALGRTLAEPVVASRDVPPHDNSAIDGYTFLFDDVAADGETRLRLGGRIAAGHPLDQPARRGEAYRIFTGAPLADGVDTVVMQEDCRLDGDFVTFGPGIKRGANTRRRGEDVKSGATVLAPGIRLRPQDVALAASLGRADLAVRKRLRAAVFSTGDEVRAPGTDLPDGCIFDANRYAVAGLLGGLGCETTDLGILPDDEGTIRDALAAAANDHHVLVTSGGVSVGDEDHVKAAVESLGSLHFWRVAIKPGRPIALGQIGDAAFVGLPGNPVAAMVTFLRIARPLILGLSGRTDTQPHFYRVPAAFEFRKKPGRREWLRVSLEPGDDGVLRAVKFRSQGSGVLTSMVDTDGLVELPEDCSTVAEGDLVDFLPYSEVLR